MISSYDRMVPGGLDAQHLLDGDQITILKIGDFNYVASLPL